MSGQHGERLDPAVVAAVYREHADELRAFLLGVLRNSDLAGEAEQAAFRRMLEAGHTAREETRKGWLFRVAYHEAMALKRRQAVNERSLRRLFERRDSPTGRTDDPLVQREAAERVRAALETLVPEQQAVVRLRIYEDKTFAVIAAELGLPLGTVLTRMRLALGKLRQAFRDEDPS